MSARPGRPAARRRRRRARRRGGRSSMSAPIERRMSMTARRVGLTPTSWMTSSASGWTAPATSQNAAAETSPGTCSSIAATALPPSLSRPPSHRPPSVRSTGTPRARSIRSVWSRVATASRTVVRPSARSPASRIADFTCALGTAVVYSIARSGVRPTTVSGGRESLRRPWSVGAHRAQWFDDTSDRSAAQRIVAVEDAPSVAARRACR